MRSQFISVVLSGVLVSLLGCGDDDSEDAGREKPEVEHKTCSQSLESWCAVHRCDNWRKFDDVVHNPPANLVVSECGDRLQLIVSDGFVYSAHVYDAKTGRLIGVRGGGDIIDEDCPDGFFGGDTEVGDCESCRLSGYSFGKTIDACASAIAKPRIQMCTDSPPSVVNDCVECACTNCYPELLTCTELEQRAPSDDLLCDRLGKQCLLDHCSGCMPDDDSDAGR